MGYWSLVMEFVKNLYCPHYCKSSTLNCQVGLVGFECLAILRNGNPSLFGQYKTVTHTINTKIIDYEFLTLYFLECYTVEFSIFFVLVPHTK